MLDHANEALQDARSQAEQVLERTHPRDHHRQAKHHHLGLTQLQDGTQLGDIAVQPPQAGHAPAHQARFLPGHDLPQLVRRHGLALARQHLEPHQTKQVVVSDHATLEHPRV